MEPVRVRATMRGEAVYYELFDVGARIHLDRISRILDEFPVLVDVERQKAAPKYLAFPKPLVVKFPAQVVETNVGSVPVALTAKVFDLGAISYAVRVPFEVGAIMDLLDYDQLTIRLDGAMVPVAEWVSKFHRRIEENLRPAFYEEYHIPSQPEPYTVYCIVEHEEPAQAIWAGQRPQIAALLAGEARAENLSAKEVEDGLRRWYSYYKSDLIVVDWDSALLIEPSGKYEDVLFVLELANLQLLELRVYDAYLDRILDKAYDDLERLFKRGGVWQTVQPVLKELSEARIELTEVADEVHNIGKFFGDWYLAKIYEASKERFYLDEWEKTVTEKLRTLNDLYQMASHETTNRRLILLELLIVLLFVVDLVALYVSK